MGLKWSDRVQCYKWFLTVEKRAALIVQWAGDPNLRAQEEMLDRVHLKGSEEIRVVDRARNPRTREMKMKSK